MHVAAEIVSSTAEWYRPIVAEKDMAEHQVDDRWAQKNYLMREFYFGRVDGKTVAILSLQHCGDYLYLGYIYVRAQTVGRGLGRQLLDFAARAAAQRGYRGLVLIAHPKATWAVRAYEKFGFRALLRSRDEVLAWNGGFLRPFYEEEFVLYRYEL